MFQSLAGEKKKEGKRCKTWPARVHPPYVSAQERVYWLHIVTPFNWTSIYIYIYTTRVFAYLAMWDFAHFLYYSYFNRYILSINFSFTETPISTYEYIILIYLWSRRWFCINPLTYTEWVPLKFILQMGTL